MTTSTLEVNRVLKVSLNLIVWENKEWDRAGEGEIRGEELCVTMIESHGEND